MSSALLSLTTHPKAPLIAGILVVAVAVTFQWTRSKRRPPLPPGPRGWPIIGNLFDVGKLPYLSYTKWSQEYGPLMSVKFGSQVVVVVNDIEVAKDLFITRGRNYNSRSQGWLATQIMTRGGRSITMTHYGPYWVLLRKLVHSTLHPHMVNRYQPTIETECRSLITELLTLGENGTKPFDPSASFIRFAFNTILTMTFGYRVESADDPVIAELKWVNDEAFSITAVDRSARMLDFFPILQHLPFLNRGLIKRAERIRDRREGIALKFIEVLRGQMERGEHIPCFASHILENMDEYNLEMLDVVNLCAALMIAGSDGPSIMLTWFAALMANHPEVQNRIHEEMDRVVGRDRAPVPADEANLPYLRATIKETMRLRPKSFTGIAHAVSEDDVYNGYL
ncbi:hypothetical protein HK104_005792 [Borealophlyctis nickersoniae]|nr:hypothetical protein HK104_005792 [Borealophlyctis nickersoniae]